MAFAPPVPAAHGGEPTGIVRAVQVLVAPTADHHPFASRLAAGDVRDEFLGGELLDLVLGRIIRQMDETGREGLALRRSMER